MFEINELFWECVPMKQMVCVWIQSKFFKSDQIVLFYDTKF